MMSVIGFSSTSIQSICSIKLSGIKISWTKLVKLPPRNMVLLKKNQLWHASALSVKILSSSLKVSAEYEQYQSKPVNVREKNQAKF